MIRLATKKDIDQILHVLESSINRFKLANIDQWQNGYPNKDVLVSDIEKAELYVMEVEGVIAAFAVLQKEQEKAYLDIDTWSFENSAVIHRIAVGDDFLKKGIASKIMEYFIEEAKLKGYDSIKVDTHKENIKMRSLLEKYGYIYKGYLVSIDRVAYELLLKEVK